MSYEDHLESCSYCQKGLQTPKPTIRIKSASSYSKQKKPTISIKSASSYRKQKKLTELGAIIKGASYPSLEPIPMFLTKDASKINISQKPGPIEREVKLKELGKMVKGL